VLGCFSEMFLQGLRGVVPVTIGLDEAEMALLHVPTNAPELAVTVLPNLMVMVVRVDTTLRPLPTLGPEVRKQRFGAVRIDFALSEFFPQKLLADAEKAKVLEPFLGNDGRRFFGLAPFFASRYSI
jgi:hypothetical protein